MKYLKIQNKGELDIRLVALMGGTTKSKDAYKIGQFGTGLKYTLAYLFRNNLDFKIFVGTHEVKLHSETENIRDQDFEIICINDQRTSITTQMGEEWKAWMIVRELWCNALDEGEAIKEEVMDIVEGKEGATTFFIQVNSDIQEVLQEWDKYFIPESLEPIFSNDKYRIYEPAPHLCIYKNGVLIHENVAAKAVFRYDILNAQINELREYKSAPSQDISNAVKQFNLTAIEYFLQHLTTDHYEGNNMDYNWFSSWGETWKVYLSGAKLIDKNVRDRFNDYGYSYDHKDYTIIPECLYRSLSECFDGLGRFDSPNKNQSFYEMPHQETEDKIMICLEKLEEMDYLINKDIQFLFGFFNDKSTLIEVDKQSKKMRVSIAITQRSIVEIISALIEKNEVYGASLENTESVKKHFIKIYTNQLINKYQVITDEPAIKPIVETPT